MDQQRTSPSSGRGVANRGFIALLATMACGAVNDNLYRGMLMLGVAAGGLWPNGLGEGGTGWVTAMLYLPFVLLLGFTGLLADRKSKRQIIVGSRIAEVVLALMVTGVMLLGSLTLACVMLILLASQSAFFSPAKYGSVPELVDCTLLSRANGVLSLLTNISIVAGLALAGLLMDAGDRMGLGGGTFVGLVMIGVAIIGLVSSLFIPRRPAADPTLSRSINGFRTYKRTLRIMRGTDLAAATTAWCLFYAVGSLIIAIIPYYGETLLISQTLVSGLMGITVVGIAVGGLAAGFGSGHGIRATLVPIGAASMAACFVLLGVLNIGYTGVMILLGVTGLCAGIFVVPILAMLQHLPVPGLRARCVGTANFMTYLAMSLSAVFFAVSSRWFGTSPATWFLICAGMMIIVTLWLMVLLPRLIHGGRPESFSSIEDRINQCPPRIDFEFHTKPFRRLRTKPFRRWIRLCMKFEVYLAYGASAPVDPRRASGVVFQHRRPDQPMTVPDAMLFDLDGTLIDSVPDLTTALNRMLQNEGREAVSETVIRNYVGDGSRLLVHRTLTGSLHGRVDDALFRRSYDAFQSHYADCCLDQTVIFDHATELLMALRSHGIKTAVVTNKPACHARTLLDAWSDLLPMDVVVGECDGCPRKPDPSMLQQAMAQCGCANAWMVGDSEVDAQAARAAGCRFIGVRLGYNHGCDIADSDPPPDEVFDDLGSLLAFMQTRWSSPS